MNKIKSFFYRLFYALPFGLKGAENEILGGAQEKNEGTTISQEVSDERVAKHMLKGEVTQEVEELRYRTYKVSNESENYDYVGNGVAVKVRDTNNKPDRKKFKFSQENSLLCASVLDELKHVDSYGIENYRIEATYKDVVRFKLEQFITVIDVDINTIEGEEKTITRLHFQTTPNPYDAKSMPFINELRKNLGINDEHAASRSEILSSLDTISFCTYKATNEQNFVTYGFFSPKFESIEETENDIVITFSWDSFARVPLNLEEKYYSRSMDEKYKKKEKKDVAINMNNVERKRYCSVCGKEMSVYDGDIQEYEGGIVICPDCIAKAMKNKNKKST